MSWCHLHIFTGSPFGWIWFETKCSDPTFHWSRHGVSWTPIISADRSDLIPIRLDRIQVSDIMSSAGFKIEFERWNPDSDSRDRLEFTQPREPDGLRSRPHGLRRKLKNDNEIELVRSGYRSKMSTSVRSRPRQNSGLCYWYSLKAFQFWPFWRGHEWWLVLIYHPFQTDMLSALTLPIDLCNFKIYLATFVMEEGEGRGKRKRGEKKIFSFYFF